MATSEDIKSFPQEDSRRFLHAVYRVGKLDESIKYYKENFGMEQLRYRDVPDDKYTNAFLAPKGTTEDKNFVLELTENYGVDSYNLGSGFGHFALAVPDVYKAAEAIKKSGGKLPRDAGPVKGGSSVIAFAEDPTGYKWELIERKGKPIREPICQVMLRVTNLERSIKWYKSVLGCKLVKERDNPDYKYKLAFMAYGPEEDETVFELTYNYGKDSLADYGGEEEFKGNAYAQTAISTTDVYKSAEAAKAWQSELGGKVVREAGPLPGLKTKITSITDPDGWKVVLVDVKDFESEL
eukprot:jgi/Astpho2/9554/Aster-03835